MEDLNTICRRAEALLSVVYHAPVHLEVEEQFESSHTVLRCKVEDEVLTAHRTVIVKQRNFDQPDAPAGFDQAMLFRNEWASLEFLTSLSPTASLGPRLVASDREAGLVVLEDLGATQSVQDVLYGADRKAAVDALVGMGQTLGRLQRVSRGREAEFLAVQAGLQAATTVCDASLDLRGKLGDLRACLAGLGIEIGDEFESAVIALENTVHGPGALRAFVHNDAGPHNFVATASGVRLLDFEFGGYGHGLVDAACARLAFPPAFRGRVLPPEVARQVEAAYLAELQMEGLDDAHFNEALAQACAHWAFTKLHGMWDGYLDEYLLEGESRDTRGGRPPERAAFFRSQVFTYLRLALTALDELDQLPVLRTALSRIVARLLDIWPGTPLLPDYPAFGGEPWREP